MSEKATNGNDAAFGHGAENGHCCGLTKREHFAAMAMSGLLGNQYVFEMDGKPDKCPHLVNIPKEAVFFADALITALNETEVK